MRGINSPSSATDLGASGLAISSNVLGLILGWEALGDLGFDERSRDAFILAPDEGYPAPGKLQRLRDTATVIGFRNVYEVALPILSTRGYRNYLATTASAFRRIASVSSGYAYTSVAQWKRAEAKAALASSRNSVLVDDGFGTLLTLLNGVDFRGLQAPKFTAKPEVSSRFAAAGALTKRIASRGKSSRERRLTLRLPVGESQISSIFSEATLSEAGHGDSLPRVTRNQLLWLREGWRRYRVGDKSLVLGDSLRNGEPTDLAIPGTMRWASALREQFGDFLYLPHPSDTTLRAQTLAGMGVEIVNDLGAVELLPWSRLEGVGRIISKPSSALITLAHVAPSDLQLCLEESDRYSAEDKLRRQATAWEMALADLPSRGRILPLAP